jgi:hypothetical protein
MGHILHDWSLQQKLTLLRKAHQALPDGGALIVYDAIIDDDRTANIFGRLMSLNMLIETPGRLRLHRRRLPLLDGRHRLPRHLRRTASPARLDGRGHQVSQAAAAAHQPGPTTAAAEIDCRKPRVVMSPSLPSPPAPRCSRRGPLPVMASTSAASRLPQPGCLGRGTGPAGNASGASLATTCTADRRRFDVSLTPAGRRRFEQAWLAHADGIGRYFVQPLAPRDIGDLSRILNSLIQANQNHGQPG